MKGTGGLIRMDASFENQRKGTTDTRRCKGTGNSNITRWTGTGCNRTRTTGNGRSDKKRKDMKKKAIMFAACAFFSLNLTAGDVKKTYVIRRGDDILEVSSTPTFARSEPVSNSFVYIDGEYLEPPYIVSVSNLAVLINGRIIQNYEPMVHRRDHYSRRVGITPESVGEAVDGLAESYVRRLMLGTVSHIVNGSMRIGYATSGGDGGASVFVERARKAAQGNEQARQELVKEMGLENALLKIRPDWIQRLAGNTNLEARATRILEAKRQREQHERERREQMERQDGHGNPRQGGNAHQ
jgi:hypothetical protein